MIGIRRKFDGSRVHGCHCLCRAGDVCADRWPPGRRGSPRL